MVSIIVSNKVSMMLSEYLISSSMYTIRPFGTPASPNIAIHCSIPYVCMCCVCMYESTMYVGGRFIWFKNKTKQQTTTSCMMIYDDECCV